jgi:hypothetical protein
MSWDSCQSKTTWRAESTSPTCPHLQTIRVEKEYFFNLVVLALAYSDVFWCLDMYIQVMLYVYCCKYCLLPPETSRRAIYPPLVQ